ncbi:MAG: dienelactone hydrolase family protein [Anaerolineales bacterium]|nr:dienelactone hydrolase family protein [Anaerolineales bacterium]
MSIQKSEIQLDVNGKKVNAYLADGGGKGVLVLHAWWGLKPFFKQVCDRLAEQGFVALAPDYYQERVATTVDEAKAMLENNNEELMGSAIKAAHDRLAAQTKGSMGVVGFSMGAGWALPIAANETDVAAVVQFYGAGKADYSNFKAKVLGHFSDVDEWESLEWVRKMEADMKAAGVDVTLHIYPGVAHWFVEEDRPEFDPAAAKLAWERTFDFLKKNL